MFDGLLRELTTLSISAWTFGTGVLILIGGLIMLYRAYQATMGMAVGSGPLVAGSVTALIGILLIVLGAFDLIPRFVETMYDKQPDAPFHTPFLYLWPWLWG